MLILSPLAKRRLANFKANRRGVWSLRIFTVLFLLSLFAELVANDKPLLVRYNGGYYTPFLHQYPETTFGGDFDSEANYQDPFVQDLIQQKPNSYIVWAPIRFSYDTIDENLDVPAPAPPSKTHWLGTDDQGRDVVARLLYGFRLSVLFAFLLTLGSTLVGLCMGAIQGYFGGRVDLYLQRFIEIWAGMPILYILMIIGSLITPSFWSLLLVMLCFKWMSLVGVVRAEFLKVRNYEYVKAARALGVGHWTIITRHLLPNAMVAALTLIPFMMDAGLVTLASLDFLGFGLPSSSPSLGSLIAQGKTNVQAPWLGLSAFFVMMLLLSLLIFIGEAVRDAFDPRRSG